MDRKQVSRHMRTACPHPQPPLLYKHRGRRTSHGITLRQLSNTLHLPSLPPPSHSSLTTGTPQSALPLHCCQKQSRQGRWATAPRSTPTTHTHHLPTTHLPHTFTPPYHHCTRLIILSIISPRSLNRTRGAVQRGARLQEHACRAAAGHSGRRDLLICCWRQPLFSPTQTAHCCSSMACCGHLTWRYWAFLPSNWACHTASSCCTSMCLFALLFTLDYPVPVIRHFQWLPASKQQNSYL